MKAPLFAVILAGGSGTRLWPLSRGNRPKQLQALSGNQTLLQQTVRRLEGIISPERLWVVTHRDQKNEVVRQVSCVAPVPAENFLAEPQSRNTLPAILWAAMEIERRHPGSVMAVFPSDHYVRDGEAFRENLSRAVAGAEMGYLMTFGIKPEGPETGFGYLRTGNALANGLFKVAAFIEKPNLETAKRLVTSSDHYWNSGIFVFSAKVFLEEAKKFQETSWKLLSERGKEAYSLLPSLSVDVGIMEKSAKVAAVPADFGWSDLGNWDAVYKVLEKTPEGNAIGGSVLAQDTRSSLLLSSQGVLATIGLSDMVVVRSGDAVLVCPRNRVQDVRNIVAAEPVSNPSTVERPWGRYTVLEEASGYKLKRIVVDPGQKLSLQRHKRRAEHWVVLEGTAQVVKGEEQIILQKNESTFIPIGEKHRLGNPGSDPLVIIEVQSGDYVEEDDIERFEDVYGRSTTG